MKFILVLLIFGSSAVHGAKSNRNAKAGNPYSLEAELSLGLPTASVENPDGTRAHYKGVAASGRGLLPILAFQAIALKLSGGLKYLDLQNTVNGDQTEVGQHVGPGLGLELQAGRFFVGYEYYYMVGRHYSIGPLSHDIKMTYSAPQLYYGMSFSFGQLSVGLSASQSSSKFSKKDTELDADSPIGDQVYWLSLRYELGLSFGSFLQGLFSNI